MLSDKEILKLASSSNEVHALLEKKNKEEVSKVESILSVMYTYLILSVTF